MFKRLKRWRELRLRKFLSEKEFVGEAYEVVTFGCTVELVRVGCSRPRWRGTWLRARKACQDDQVLEITYCQFPNCRHYNALLTYRQVRGLGRESIMRCLPSKGTYLPLQREINRECIYAIVGWFRKEVRR